MKIVFASLLFLAFSATASADNPAIPPSTEGGSPTEEVERLQELFQQLDTEGRGFLTREQISAALGLGQERFQNLDEDGDGVISREEFLTLSLKGAAKGTESSSQRPADGTHYLRRDSDDSNDSDAEQTTQPQDRTESKKEPEDR